MSWTWHWWSLSVAACRRVCCWVVDKTSARLECALTENGKAAVLLMESSLRLIGHLASTSIYSQAALECLMTVACNAVHYHCFSISQSSMHYFLLRKSPLMIQLFKIWKCMRGENRDEKGKDAKTKGRFLFFLLFVCMFCKQYISFSLPNGKMLASLFSVS